MNYVVRACLNGRLKAGFDDSVFLLLFLYVAHITPPTSNVFMTTYFIMCFYLVYECFCQ